MAEFGNVMVAREVLERASLSATSYGTTVDELTKALDALRLGMSKHYVIQEEP